MVESPLTLEKNTDERLCFLAKVSIFKELSYESLNKISEKVQVDSFPKDTTIIENGSTGTRLYIIKKGSSRVVAKSEGENEEFTIATINSGECLGEMSLLTGGPCCATVKTNEDSLLYFISKSDFDNIISENPQIYKHFNKLLAERVNKQNIKSTQLKEREIALNRYLQNTKEHQYGIVIGKCRRMRNTLQEVEKLSKSDDHTIIVGEQGSGKELLARKIHADSVRAKHPVIEYAIPRDRRKTDTSVLNEQRKREQSEYELFGSEGMYFMEESEKKIGRIELVDNGTLIIKNIEHMPLPTQKKLLKFLETGIYSRIGAEETIYSNVKIIITTKDYDLSQKQLDPRLFSFLSTHKLEIPTLSERKRDIPLLMEHFAEKISKIKHTPIKKFTKDATNKLLKYDYPGNVKELENVIERAVELSGENKIIEEEEIFLGDTDVEDKIRFNLLNIPLIKSLCLSNSLLLSVKIILLIFFISILYFLFIQPDFLIGEKNIVLVLCWKVGLPFLFLAIFFLARFGCGICPMSFISKMLNRVVNLKIPVPSFIKEHDLLIMGSGFVVILFVEEYTHMAGSTINTAYLILGIFMGAIVFDLIFEKSAWCRHLCPLGGLSGLFSMSSILEIRANKHTCSTICTTHDCFKGSEKAEHCPMYLHLQFLPDNRNCKFCLNCIKNCKHNSPRLNLRLPGAEIGSLKQPKLAGAIMSIVLCGLLIAEIPTKLGINQANFPFIFFLSIFFALSMFIISNYFTAFITGDTAIKNLTYFGYTLLPLTLCGYIALKLAEIFSNAEWSLTLFDIYEYNFNFIIFTQAALVIIGFFTTEHLIYKVIQNRIGKGKRSKVFAIQGVVPLIFAALFVSLFYSWNYTSYFANIF